MRDEGDPESFFARFGIGREALLDDLMTIYTKVQHSGPGPHIVSGPIAIAGAQPGDVLAIKVLRPPRACLMASTRCAPAACTLPDEFTLNRSIVIPFDMDRNVAKFSDRIEIPWRRSSASWPPARRAT